MAHLTLCVVFLAIVLFSTTILAFESQDSELKLKYNKIRCLVSPGACRAARDARSQTISSLFASRQIIRRKREILPPCLSGVAGVNCDNHANSMEEHLIENHKKDKKDKKNTGPLKDDPYKFAG